jgi:hypothetical protein
MTNKLTRNYQHPKVREARTEIALAGTALHGLPRIARANEAWLADSRTLEVELETVGGQRVIVPLDAYAIENLAELLDAALKLRNTDQG